MFQVTGAFAKFERSMIKQRINAGLKRAVEQGKQLGRPNPARKSDPRSIAGQEGHAGNRQGSRRGKRDGAAPCPGNARLVPFRRRRRGRVKRC